MIGKILFLSIKAKKRLAFSKAKTYSECTLPHAKQPYISVHVPLKKGPFFYDNQNTAQTT